MTLFKDKLKIDSQRLQNWDYSSEALYFITKVAKNRKCIFGDMENEKMILNKNGQIIENELLKSINIRKNWFFHNWIIMPNHIHVLIEIQENRNSIETNNSRSAISVEANGCASDTMYIKIAHTHIAETHSCAPLRT